MSTEYVQYKVCLTWDEETSQMDAAVPTLGIGDCGPDTNAALDSVREMALFHIEGLMEEGMEVPVEAHLGSICSSRTLLP